MKPGWKTSEFWITLAVIVLMAYVACDLSRPTSQTIAALVIAAVKGAWYLSKRTELKVSAQETPAPMDAPPAAGFVRLAALSAVVAGVLQALVVAMALHAVGLNAHGWALLCLAVGVATGWLILKAFPAPEPRL